MDFVLNGRIGKLVWRALVLTSRGGLFVYKNLNMKKTILVISLIIFITPSIALASWWNPFSWFNFSFFRQVETYENTNLVDTPPSSENIDTNKEIIFEEKTLEETPQKTAVYTQDVIQNTPTPVTSSEPAVIDLYAKYRDPKTGGILSPEEYAEMLNNKAIESMKKKQTNDFDYDSYNVSGNSGKAYSPEQLSSIDCAYYGIGCSTSDSVQVNNNQYVSPNTPAQASAVNCSNYQIEKANLDQQYSNSGTLFSGARVGAQNALKAKYPGCF